METVKKNWEIFATAGAAVALAAYIYMQKGDSEKASTKTPYLSWTKRA